MEGSARRSRGSGARTGAVLLALLGGIACSGGPPGFGDPCRYTLGDAPGSPTEETCPVELYCSANTGTCRLRGDVGDVCSDGYMPCAVDLVCGPGDTCMAPGVDGVACGRDAHCAEGLVCNHGYHPEDARLGECHPPAGVGEPCGWGGPGDDPTNADTLFAHGCAAGLVCVPPLPDLPTTTSVDPATSGCASVIDHECGYPGTCAPAGSVPDGGGCLDDTACASGRCLHVTAPHGADSSPLFGLGGGEFAGAWPDVCAPVDALPDGAMCADAPTGCAPGLHCDYATTTARCGTWLQHPRGERCGSFFEPSRGVDLDCRFGLICEPEAGGMFCRDAGTVTEGQYCPTAWSCAPGLGCRSSDQTCVPLGAVGSSCAVGELPCALGLWCDQTSHCVAG